MKENIEQLQKIIEQLHHCTAHFVESLPVTETFKDKTVWEGLVSMFDLEGHSKANKCYAWSSPIEGSKKRRFYAVLNIPPVDSPQKAVRASIIEEYRSQSKEKR
jgi:hypothetical protein